MSAPDLLKRFVESQAALEAACAPLSVEDYVVQAFEDASPVKWHLAHVAWFFETFVLAGAAGYQPFDPRYRWLFNSYYEAVGDRHPRPDRGLLSRPTLEEVRRYRRHVGEAVVRLLEDARQVTPALAFAVELGANHAEQHHELIATDVKAVLARNPLRPAYAPRPARAPAAPARVEVGWVSHEGGLVEVGHAGESFAFDNERPRHKAFLEPFQLANRLVTNGEWLEFMDAGGYRDPMLWLSDGWTVRRRRPVGGVLAARERAFGPAGAGLPRQLLRGGRVRELAGRAAAVGGGVGGGGGQAGPGGAGALGGPPGATGERARARRGGAGLRRGVAVDAQPVRRLPRLPPLRRRLRRVQRQVHVQPAGAARVLLRHPAPPRARQLPELLPARRAVAVHRPAAGARRAVTQSTE